MSLASSPAAFAEAFAANFNRRVLEQLAFGYADDAVMDLGGGQRFEGREAIRAPLGNFLAAGLPISVIPRFHAENGDLGIAIFDWSIIGAASDGSAVNISGRAVDVLRRDRDGWRQLIDLPFGASS